MSLRGLFGVPLSCAFLLCASAGCDIGGSSHLQPAGTKVASGGGGAGGMPPIVVGTTGGAGSGTGGSASGGNGGVSSGGASGAGGGAVGVNSCGGAQLLFVIQRSGAMFEQPDGDTKYWGMVHDAVAASDGALAAYWDKLDVGALFFVRLQGDDAKCPVVSSAAPKVGAVMPLGELFTSNASDYQTLADADAKMDAPVPEAVAAGAALLTGAARHLVLITTAVPDTCAATDNPCTVDPTIKAVQDAQKTGVTTHVIGLGDTGLLDATGDDNGYQTYLTQLANAGAGKPVKLAAAFGEKCGSDPKTAQYADASGDAKAVRAESASDIKTALAAILTSICP